MKQLSQLASSLVVLSLIVSVSACKTSRRGNADRLGNSGLFPLPTDAKVIDASKDADVIVDQKGEVIKEVPVLVEDLTKNPTIPTPVPVVETPVDTAPAIPGEPIVETPPVVTAPVDEPVVTPPEPVPPPTKAPSGFAIEAIEAAGNGCVADSFSTNISPDQKAFTVTFSKFDVELAAGDRRAVKSCRLTLKMTVPTGWQYAVASFNSRGFVELSDGAESVHATRYYFKKRGRAGGFRHTEVGPVAKDFVYTDDIKMLTGTLSHEWSPCRSNRDLQMETAVRVRNMNVRRYPEASGLFTNDSTDGEITEKFGLTWRRCAATAE